MTAKVQRCNAVYRTTKGLKRYCRTPAGKGTDHKGQGPCQEHDLMCEAVAAYDRRQQIPTAFAERRSYTLKLSGPLGEKVKALGGETVHFNPEGRVADMNFEIVCAKALVAQLIEDYTDTEDAMIVWAKAFKAGKIETEPPGRMYKMADLEKMLLTSGRLIALAKSVEDLVPLRTVAGVFKAMYNILETNIADREELVKVLQEFESVTQVFKHPEQVMRVRPVNQLPAGRRRPHGNLVQGRV